MKKTKFMIGALVLSMGLLGTGYAYWTDTVTVSTAVATGDLDVSFVKEATAKKIFGSAEHIEGGVLVDDKYLTTTAVAGTVDDNTATITINDMCPGYTGGIELTAKNTGTMAARLQDIEFKNLVMSPELKKDIGVKIEVNKNGTWKPICTGIPYSFKIADVEYISLEELPEKFNTLFNQSDWKDTLYLENNNVAKIKVTLAMKSNASNGSQSDKKKDDIKKGSFDIKFNWTQYNNPLSNEAE